MNKNARLYAILTQGFLQMFVLAYLGYKIGADWWLKSDVYGALFAGIGVIIGVVLLGIMVVKESVTIDKRKDI